MKKRKDPKNKQDKINSKVAHCTATIYVCIPVYLSYSLSTHIYFLYQVINLPNFSHKQKQTEVNCCNEYTVHSNFFILEFTIIYKNFN